MAYETATGRLHEDAAHRPPYSKALAAFRRRWISPSSLIPFGRETKTYAAHASPVSARPWARNQLGGDGRVSTGCTGTGKPGPMPKAQKREGRVRGHPLDGDAEGTEERNFAGPSRQRPEWGPTGSRTQMQLTASTQAMASSAADKHALTAAGVPSHCAGHSAISSAGASSPVNSK